MNRRQVLGTLAAAGSISVAGCSSVLGSRGTVLGTIKLVNSSRVANRIRLMVDRGEETLLDRTISLAAIDAATGTRGTRIDPSWSKTRGEYTLRALHYDDSGNRETSSREYTFTRDDYTTYYGDSHEDPGCIGAVVTIGNFEDTENGVISISPAYMDNPCGGSGSQ